MKLSKILNSVKTRPKALIILGAPKSGKTTWLNEYIEKNKLSNYINLNIDSFNNTHERSSLFENCLNNKENFIYEGVVLKEDRFNNLLSRIREHNYKISLVYINKSMGFLLENNDNKKFEHKIKKLYHKTTNIFNKFKDKVDRIIEV